jgi:anti-sigma factor RsiW
MSEDLEALEAQFSDYIDDAMSAEQRRAFEAKLAASPEAKRAFDAFKVTLEAVSGLHKMSAPHDFDAGVANTIHRRSGGRFFGRKAFGDRVPFELLAIVALALLLGVYLLMRASTTGSAHLDGPSNPAPAVSPEAKEVIPRP